MLAKTAREAAADTVTLSRAEYEALIERAELAEDLAAYDTAEADPHPGYPIEVVERLLAGESPLRVYRQHLGLTLEQLAARVGVGKSFLGHLENGRRNASAPVLKRLARALDVDVDDLI